MKNDKLWRIIWIVGIYAILCLILYLVIIYKVKWEDKDLNKYLYFYNCNSLLCTSEIKIDDYYSRVVCNDNICPYISNIDDNLVILNDNNTSYLFDYLNNQIISDEYSEYKYLNNKYYSVRNSNYEYGVINREGELVLNFQKYQIKDYNGLYYVYKNNNNQYQINTFTKYYDDIILINEELYAYLLDNLYYIASYNTEEVINNLSYSYIYPYNDIIFAISNKSINIYTSDLKNTLLMNIPTYYEYIKEEEKSSLNLNIKDNILFFTIINEDNSKTIYKYDITNKKLYN